MKTIVLFSLFVFLSIGAVAQNHPSFKLTPPNNFKNGILEADSSYLSFSTEYKMYDFNKVFNETKQKKVFVKGLHFSGGMPIVKPQGFNWNMPIAVPDSNIVYSIQNVGPISGGLLKYKK